MLDLDARIDLDEVEGAGVRIHQELDRARAVIVGGVADLDGVVGEFGTLTVIEIGRRRALHDLLVATLHRTVALEEMDDGAVLVAEDLDLDVAGALDQLLQVDLVLAEGRLGLALGGGDLLQEARLVADDAHAASAAAPGGLQHDGIADALGLGLHDLHVVGQRIGRRHHRHAGGDREVARGDLVAELAHRLRRGTDEDDAGVGAGLGELGALRQKAVAGVDGVGAALARHPDDLGDREIGLDRPQAAADLIGLVGLKSMQGELIFLGEDRDRLQAEFVGGTEDANRDFGPVGYEQLRDRHLAPPSTSALTDSVVPLYERRMPEKAA